MTRTQQTVQETLHLLIDASEKLLSIDLEDEGNLVTLEVLQTEQLRQREILERLWTPITLQDSAVKELCQHAYELEIRLNERLRNVRQEMSTQLFKIQEGFRMKNTYQQTYSQAEGYFFDSKK